MNVKAFILDDHVLLFFFVGISMQIVQKLKNSVASFKFRPQMLSLTTTQTKNNPFSLSSLSRSLIVAAEIQRVQNSQLRSRNLISL